VIVLDTHAWVRWLHPEISRNLPEPLRQWLRPPKLKAPAS
jgi:PIN domain nuclease of toxin-antitoxin system